MAKVSRKWWLLGVLAVVVGYLLYHFWGSLKLGQFSGAKLWEVIRSANYFYLLVSLLAIYVCYGLRALRWQKFQAHVGPANFWNIYLMSIAGFTALFLLGRAAEPVRPLLISRKDKIPLADTFGVYALERILDAASTALLTAIALFIFESSGHLSGEGAGGTFEKAARTGGTVCAIIAAVAIIGLIYLRLHGSAMLERRMEGWLAAHGWRVKVARILLGFSRGVQTMRSWGDVFSAVFYSLLHWVSVVLCFFLVLRSFGGKLGALSFADAMLVLVFTMVGSTVQLPGVGGGAQALAIVALTRLYGVEQEAAVAAAFVLWIVTFAACTLVGLPLLLKEGISLGELKRMRKEEDAEIDSEMLEHPVEPQ
jgi:glycosyltransferase 2 family protein